MVLPMLERMATAGTGTCGPDRRSVLAGRQRPGTRGGRRHMNNILEQDHRYVKKRVVASQWFRSVDGAVNTIAGYEAMNIIRKGQIRWLPKTDVVGQVRFVERTLGIAA